MKDLRVDIDKDVKITKLPGGDFITSEEPEHAEGAEHTEQSPDRIGKLILAPCSSRKHYTRFWSFQKRFT